MKRSHQDNPQTILSKTDGQADSEVGRTGKAGDVATVDEVQSQSS